METASKAIVAFLTVSGVALFLALLIGLPIKWSWNYLMPDLFGLPEIGFWQAVVMYILCYFLFQGSTTSSKD